MTKSKKWFLLRTYIVVDDGNFCKQMFDKFEDDDDWLWSAREKGRRNLRKNLKFWNYFKIFQRNLELGGASWGDNFKANIYSNISKCCSISFGISLVWPWSQLDFIIASFCSRCLRKNCMDKLKIGFFKVSIIYFLFRKCIFPFCKN